MIFKISEREIDNASFIIFHKLVKPLYKVSPGRLYRAIRQPPALSHKGHGLTRRGAVDFTNPGGLMIGILDGEGRSDYAAK